MRGLLRTTGSLTAVVLLMLSLSAVASAQEAADITLDSPIRAFELGPTEKRADLDVKFRNTADGPLLVKLTFEDLPEGWDIGVWNRFFDYKVGELVVEPTTEDTPSPNLRMRIAFPVDDDDRPDPGEYSFVLNVTSPDGRVVYDRAQFTIEVPEEPTVVEEEETPLKLRSSFPELSGEAGMQREFEVVIRNETGEERVFDLRADVLNESDVVQRNWLLFFKPAFGTERIISSISVPDNLTENIDVLLTPPRNTPAGRYRILVTVSSEGEEGVTAYEEVEELTLNISGQGLLSATTVTGLFSADATAGGVSNIVLRLWNVGSAPLTDIKLSADQLTNWKVTYDRDSIDLLSDLSGENFVDIALKIEPPGDAVPGDYFVTLRASNVDSADAIDIRVTVAQSTIWGWLGIVMVLGVLGGLVGLFVRLGRR